jgi:alpha-mannosidase
MALTIEWTRRIDTWRGEIRKHVYRPLEDVAFEGFVTKEQLSAEEAAKGRFVPTPPGTRWGAKWEYGWFRASVKVPKAAAGRRIVLVPDFGGESLVFVDGRAAAARDNEHREITLARRAKAGERFALLAEAYAGHGPRVDTVGPVPPGRETVPEPGPTQAVVGESSFGIWEEDVYQLVIDVETLYLLRGTLDPDSLRVAEIDRGLRAFTTIVDFELPRELMLETVRRCRRALAPLLACVNGSTAPTLYAFGHGHIDVAWLWPLAETERKIARTFSTQLALMGEYPDYRFLQSEPHLYLMLKEKYPELYRRVLKAVRGGRVVAEGGMWVEADTNLSGGESLIRQFLHGTRFFREEFGVDSELLWLPDAFGYSGALPQIMRGCGIRWFSTAKIYWIYNGGDPFPYTTFHWEGIDGTRVLASFSTDYNSHTDPASVAQRWKERPQKDGFSTRLLPFGHGDGGGGPTRDHLEYLRRLGNLEGSPRLRSASPVEYFRQQENQASDLPCWKGELYFQAHRGTYTSQARTKRANRLSEIMLREAEAWAVFATAATGRRFPAEDLASAWRLVLLNQFHDIIPGSSIERVYVENLAHHAKVQETAASVIAASTNALAGAGTSSARATAHVEGRSLAVFNSLSWERTALVELPAKFGPARDANGNPVDTQKIDGAAWAEVTVPPVGWTTLTSEPEGRSAALGTSAATRSTAAGAAPSSASKPAQATGRAPAPASAPAPAPARAAVDGPRSAGRRVIENGLLRVVFDERGEIASIRDKEADRELAAGPCNALRMYKDVPTAFDAWDVDSMYPLTPVTLEGRASIEVLDAGPLVARLRIARRINESDLVQVVSLRRGSRRVDFDTTVEWRESHKLLKVEFAVDHRAEDALHEIQFGHLRRPTHRSRPYDQDRFEVSNHRWTAIAEEGRGFAVLNDGKYGVNVLGSTIGLTLLKSALAPDMRADKGTQRFTYAFFAWNGSFADSGIVRQGYELNVPVVTAAGGMGKRSFVTVSAPNVVLETVKAPEEGDAGELVLRLYESMRTRARCAVKVDLPVVRAIETDMRERTLRGLPVKDNAVTLELRPFEIKTVLLQLGTGGAEKPATRRSRGGKPRHGRSRS